MSGSRSERLFATWVTLAYVAVGLFAMGHHEMWRDELHCWLVARDSPTPWAVVHNRAYDGQPPLWYLLLWILEKTTHDPGSMQVVHVGIAAAAVWVFVRHAPFARPLRALFPFGYFVAYEYVALSRCYGLALLLALLLCVRHPLRLTRPIPTALLLMGLALTTTVGTMVAGGYAAALAVEYVEGLWRGDPAMRRGWIPLCAAAMGGLAAGLCAWPPPDSTVTRVAWPHELPSDDAPTRLIVALFPVPRPDFYFWNSNALLSYEPFRAVALWVSMGLAAWILFLLSSDRSATMLFAVGSALLVALFAFVYGGDVRHQGFLFVLLLMGAWIAKRADGGTLPAGWRRFRDRALGGTLAVVLVVHIAGAAVALYFDGRYIFSSGQRAARVLRANGLENALLVAEMDFPATAVIGWLGTNELAYTPRTGRQFSFVKWTADRHLDPTDGETVAFASAIASLRGRDAILLMNRPLLPELIDGINVSRIAELYDSMIQEENFYIYRVHGDDGFAKEDPRHR
jgi:hypothetical protein